MAIPISNLSPSDPDPALLDRLAILSRVWLALAAGASLLAALAWLVPWLGAVLPGHWRHMELASALAVLLTAGSLEFSAPRHSESLHRLSQACSLLVALLAADQLSIYVAHGTSTLSALMALYTGNPRPCPEEMPPAVACCFVLLGISALLLPARERWTVLAGDLLALVLGFPVLVLCASYVFSAAPLFGPPNHVPASSLTLICLALLTQVVFFRRSEYGLFTIVAGRGLGSRLARYLVPAMLILQFLRETLRAHLIGTARMAPHYMVAFLTSASGMAAVLIVLFFAWRINRMERQIQELSLRDALTGLYNLRGFRLLAEQALRLAHRSDQPFSVLFMDMDDLKQVNDTLGHDAGSQCLMEAAKILTATFRETDVVGRVGGDEFAVAGQFSQAEMAAAVQRLEEAVRRQNAAQEPWTKLSISVGHATTEATGNTSLTYLLALADDAMYEHKRSKKPEPAKLRIV